MSRLLFALALPLAACDLAAKPGVPADATSAREVATPTATCASDADCDDQRACTVDRCVASADDGLLHCAWSLAVGSCFVNDVCATAGDLRAGSPCEQCDPTVDQRAWTRRAEGASCDDGDACTTAESCSAGRCVSQTTLSCDDHNPCTHDRCDPATGCVAAPIDGGGCDDGDPCTLADHCVAGACAGAADACDDGDPCTADACTASAGCTHTITDGLPCQDGDACTTGDRCVDDVCMAGDDGLCDDLNPCTIDTCDREAGCVHLPTLSPCCIGVDSVCDDGDPCTSDACDALTGACSYAPTTAACDDGDPCTVDDVCADGRCGGLPRDCDDGDRCTLDVCAASLPGLCLHTADAGQGCDDGIACTTSDTCGADGRCRGDASACVCTPSIDPDGVKLSSVLVGVSGFPGEGLDVDQDPTTCAPEGQCEGGVDNTLSLISGFADPALVDAVDQGQVLLVATFSPLTAATIDVAIYQAHVVTPGCDLQHQTCAFEVDRSFLDPVTCAPVAALHATLSGSRLVGGGPGTTLPFDIPFPDGSLLHVIIANLRIEATVTRAGTDPDQVTGLSGVLGGAVPKQTLLDGIQGLPDSAFPAPLTKASVTQLVTTLIANDIDTDGDGQVDAASIGIKMEAIDADILGVHP